MQNKHRFLFFSLAGILMALLLSAASIPASGAVPAGSRFYESRQDNLISGSEQTSPCAILMEAAKKGGVPGTLVKTMVDENYWGCSISFDLMDENLRFLERSQLFLGANENETEETCGVDSSCKLTTYHGYSAAILTFPSPVPSEPDGHTLSWVMPRGNQAFRLGVYVGFSGKNPEQYAEALWSVAEDRLPLSEAPADDAEPPAVPVDPGEVVPDQPEVPTDQPVPAESGGLFGIPLAVILASLGIPVAGAISGAAVSSLLSAISSAATAAAPIQPPFTRELDRDELADQFSSGLSKEEFILARTRADLSQNLGEEFDKFSPADQANLVEFQQRVHDLIQKKIKDGYYVKNPDVDISIPFLPHVGVMNMANELIDPTPIGMLSNYKGGRCGEYTDWGRTWTKDLLAQTGFRGQDICVSDIEISWSSIDNHGATETRFPNGKRVVVDYHQSFQNSKPVIFSEKNWITRNKYRCSNLLITPEIRYDGVSGNKYALRAMFDSSIPIAENQSKFIEQAKDKPEARAIVREFYDEFLKDSGIMNAPPPQDTPVPDLKDLVNKLPKDPRY